jgi:hypothetical protein
MPRHLTVLADECLHSGIPASAVSNAFTFDQLESLDDLLNFEWTYNIGNIQ